MAAFAEVDMNVGLSAEDVLRSRSIHGPNVLRLNKKPLTFLRVFWEEIREPMILLLLVVGVMYSVWGDLFDALFIFGIILLVVLLEVLALVL